MPEKKSSCMGSTAVVFENLALPAMTATIGAVAYQDIQNSTRENDPDGHHRDNYSMLSSIASGFGIGFSAYEYVKSVVSMPAVWHHFSLKERTLVGLPAVVGSLLECYSMSRAGVEHNTGMAGLAATLGIASVNLSKCAYQLYAGKHAESRQEEEYIRILRNA